MLSQFFEDALSCYSFYNYIMSNCIQAFQQFLQQIKERDIVKPAIQKAAKQYCLKAYDIIGITVESAKDIFQSIQEKFYKKKPQNRGINWFENQLRIFVWTLACYIYDKGIQIEELNDKDWDFLSTIFAWKDPKLFDYQCHSIYLSPQKTQLWVKDQDEILRNIINQKDEKAKWNEVSKQLFQISDKKYFRTPKQCRERWNNHLDPKKIKGSWKIQQCLKMFEFVRDEGRKWAKLVKILDNSRDEHSIKNKFNSIYKKQSKMNIAGSERQIFGIIIKRLKKTLHIRENNVNKNEDNSFDLNDMQQQNYQFPREIINPPYQPVHTSKFTESLRMKLLNFSSEPKKTSIGTQASLEQKFNIKAQKQDERYHSQSIEEEDNMEYSIEKFSHKQSQLLNDGGDQEINNIEFDQSINKDDDKIEKGDLYMNYVNRGSQRAQSLPLDEYQQISSPKK